MAETVKKSRIVSDTDENLEESLLQEFNLRLNKCMSREDLEDEEFIQIEKHCNGQGENGYQDLVDTNLEIDNCNLSTKSSNNEEPLKECSNQNLPTTCLTETTDCDDESDNPESKSVKDRMFLSTDDASCLLFTQTVTSPMLTPSEENIDFLKGFRRESSQTTLSEHTNATVSPPKLEEVKSEEIPLTTSEPIYENLSDLKNDELLQPRAEEDAKEPEIPLVSCQPVLEAEETPLVIAKTSKRSENVKVLKTQFMKSTAEPLKSPRTDTTNDELEELKSLNLIKQIHKFENSQDTNLYSNGVSTVTQSHIVETTTEVHSSGDVSLKKKKTKKSKNQHEKENISVNDNQSNKEESFYNVNVKNLCRSYGDLTKLGCEINISLNFKLRTKSMNDIRTYAEVEKVLSRVSVKALRERFNNNNIINTNSQRHYYHNGIKHIRGKSSFSKFDALQKNNAINRANTEGQNGSDLSSCKKCGKPVFQMERVIAEKCIYHRNCFRCVECSKQLLVDNFESNEGKLYCKPHFRALFTPKAVEDDTPAKPRKHELIIRENQPVELPPEVARASDKPDLGLEELQSLNVKERFRVFENAQTTTESQLEKSPIKMERSPSILSKLARFQAKGMNVGVTDDALNGIPVEASSSGEEEEEEMEGEDAELVRAKRVQKEKPFHFSQMSDVKNKWEQGNQQSKEDRREERKQEIQNIRSRLFMGKQGKMKEAYQQAIAESESGAHLKKEIPLDSPDTRSIKDKFEKGELNKNDRRNIESEDMTVFESGICKQSRSIFQELDSTDGKPLKMSPSSGPKLAVSVRNAREAYIAKQSSEDTIKSSDQQDEITVETADIQNKFKFFETYKEPQQKRREFRITPPREGQIKSVTPDRDVYVDPDVVRSDECVEDSVVAKATHTATKMLSKFRQMEENLQKAQEPQGLKPLKRFTPPREPLRRESSSEEESEEDEIDNASERELFEAKKAARTKQFKDKFERWDENEVRRDNSVSVIEDYGDEQSQIETAKSLRAKFESLKETQSSRQQTTRVKVNRFVNVTRSFSNCQSCNEKVYPLEVITVHGLVFHKNCFRCKECNSILRMDTYCYNQGLLYCTTHFKRLFITKGNYDTAFGLEQHKEKWNVTTVA